MAFDVRVGLFDDPPSKETKKMLKMIKAVSDGFALLAKLNSGWEELLHRFIEPPSYRKFVETQDITFSASQEIVKNSRSYTNKRRCRYDLVSSGLTARNSLVALRKFFK